jgi:hypothetical protein
MFENEKQKICWASQCERKRRECVMKKTGNKDKIEE